MPADIKRIELRTGGLLALLFGRARGCYRHRLDRMRVGVDGAQQFPTPPERVDAATGALLDDGRDVVSRQLATYGYELAEAPDIPAHVRASPARPTALTARRSPAPPAA
jgi:hypothetical protein